MTCIITPHTPRHHPGCACHEARRDAELAAARAALLALAPKCHFCESRPATRGFHNTWVFYRRMLRAVGADSVAPGSMAWGPDVTMGVVA